MLILSNGGGVGELQAIPGGSVTDVDGVGLLEGKGGVVTTGCLTPVGLCCGSPPHEMSAKPMAAHRVRRSLSFIFDLPRCP
jgi:hypothetical protein